MKPSSETGAELTETPQPAAKFSEHYGQLRSLRADRAREGPADVSEEVLQAVWYDQLFLTDALCLDDGRPLRVLSPGWWNRSEGPDFKGAQLEIAGKLRTGDVEIHLKRGGWNEHGHHLDHRYDDVRLHVVLEDRPAGGPVATSLGKHVPTLLLGGYLEEDVQTLADRLTLDAYPFEVEGALGRCSAMAASKGPDHLTQLLHLAGDWRMLFKARTLRERSDRTNENQALYEEFLAACGFGHYKHHFRGIARQLHYDRVCQLAQEDPLLLETAFLQLAGLLPDSLPKGTSANAHFGRLRALRRDRLAGLRPLPLEWKRVGVRPNNNPERRLAGAARFLAHTARNGLVETFEAIWEPGFSARERRFQFEELFPSPMGFWATHCTWTGKKMAKPQALLGPGRVRAIIGNVIVPAALANARQRQDRIREDRIFEFFAALPKEPENRIQKAMLPRIFGEVQRPRISFRVQQGVLQLYHDWCEPNPSCQNCRVLGYFGQQDFG